MRLFVGTATAAMLAARGVEPWWRRLHAVAHSIAADQLDDDNRRIAPVTTSISNPEN